MRGRFRFDVGCLRLWAGRGGRRRLNLDSGFAETDPELGPAKPTDPLRTGRRLRVLAFDDRRHHGLLLRTMGEADTALESDVMAECSQGGPPR